MYIDGPWQRKLREKRIVSVVDASVISTFFKYLRTLRWHSQSLDWTAMPSYDSFRLTVDNERTALEWIRRMAIGKRSHVVVTYTQSEPGLMCTIDMFVPNLGSLFSNTGGKNYLFGLDQHPDGYEYDFRSLLEFDGGEMLTAVKCNSPVASN
jgi:hypothetical protein